MEVIGSVIYFSIGFSIAKKLKEEGASVMVSSRKESNVKTAVDKLKEEDGGQVEGTVCHVGKAEHRANLVKEVIMNNTIFLLMILTILSLLQTISRFGKLDILVSNAAVNPTFGRTLDVSG